LSGHGFNRAVLPSPLASLPLARLSSSRRLRRACAKSSPRPRLLSPAFVRRCEQLAPFARLSSSRRPWRACAKSSSWPRLFSPAFVRRCQQLAPFARFSSSRRPRRACAKSSPRPLRISRSAKLDHLVTQRKKTTSHFLTDNFCVPFALTPISKAQPGLTLLLRDRPARGSRFRPCSPLATRHCPS
jgi:hypothetical protein